MKRYIYLIVILLTGCNNPETDMLVDLHTQEGYGLFIPGRVILWPAQHMLDYSNVPGDIGEYIVRSMPLQPDQYFWNKYSAGVIEIERFEEIADYYRIDTTCLSNDIVDCEVLILSGTKNNRRIIIIDSDNDEDFSDEEILEYDYPLSIEKQKEIEESLPAVRTRYEYYENSRLMTREVNIKPSPYKGSLALSYNTDNDIEKQYFLFAGFSEFKKGTINLRGQKREVFVSNGFSRIDYTRENVSLFITSENNSLTSETEGNTPLMIGDIFNVNGHDYLIDSVTKWGDRLLLKYAGPNTKPRGFSEGFYMPEFEAIHPDQSVSVLSQSPGRYVLFDFWGTWCNPCIALIPELKKIHSEYHDKNFALVSVAYDSDPQKVLDFVIKEQMNWEQLFVSQNQPGQKSLVEIMRITSFPTTILVAPDGKIIARNKPLNELEEILNNLLQ